MVIKTEWPNSELLFHKTSFLLYQNFNFSSNAKCFKACTEQHLYGTCHFGLKYNYNRKVNGWAPLAEQSLLTPEDLEMLSNKYSQLAGKKRWKLRKRTRERPIRSTIRASKHTNRFLLKLPRLLQTTSILIYQQVATEISKVVHFNFAGKLHSIHFACTSLQVPPIFNFEHQEVHHNCLLIKEWYLCGLFHLRLWHKVKGSVY